jgi:metallo-beta-lactamase class B
LPEILLSLLLTLSSPAAAQTPAAQTPAATPAAPLAPLSSRLQNERDNADLQKVAPFKVFDNLYYVGVGWVASWLLTTSDGLIVIDTLEPRYVDHLLSSIAKLGFDPKNIKHVIVLQAHFDHLGGAALLQEKYGAKVWMGEGDWQMLAQQGASGRGAALQSPRRDGVIRDGDILTLGATSLKLFFTPGHTPGTTSIEMTVSDAGRPYKAFFFGGSAPAPGPAAAKQFLATVQRIEEMQQGVQVRLVNHGFSDPQFWERVDRLARRKPGEPHPFVAPELFVPWLQQLKTEAAKQIDAPPPLRTPQK